MAVKYARAVGGNYTTDATWSTTTGGAADTTKPVAGDTANLDANSGQITIDGAAACAILNCTGYTNTLTWNAALTTTGSTTFASGMTVAGTAGTLICTGTATLTSAGKTLTCALTMSGTITYTLADAWTVNGLTTLGAGTATTTINAQTLNCVGGLTIGGTSSIVLGTTALTLTGGTWSSTQTTGALRNNLSLAGTVTVSGAVRYNTGTLTYTSGTITVAGSTLTIGAATTLNTNGMGWDAVTIGGTTTFTVTLASDFQPAVGYGGIFSLTNTTSTIFSGAFDIHAQYCTISGSQTVTLSGNVLVDLDTIISDACVINGAFEWETGGLTMTGALSGTAKIVLGGSGGTWSGSATLSSNLDLDAGGTSLSGTIAYSTGTITYIAGTVSPGSSTLNIVGACTINTEGMSWFNVTLTAALTLTLPSTMRLADTGTLTLPNAAVTFAGTGGWDTSYLTNTSYTATRITTFNSSTGYVIRHGITTVGTTPTIRATWKSSTPGTQASLHLGANIDLGGGSAYAGATQDVGFLDPTDIWANYEYDIGYGPQGGQPVFTYHGVVTTSANWITELPDLLMAQNTSVYRGAMSGM